MKCIFSLVVISVGILLSGAGCGESERSVPDKTVNAEGVLTFRGMPLEDFLVTFHPSGKQRPATGKTDATGRFKLGTNDVGDGAVTGSHKVTAVYVGPTSSTNQEAGKEEVVAPPVAKVQIPAKYFTPEATDLTVELSASGSTDLKLDLK